MTPPASRPLPEDVGLLAAPRPVRAWLAAGDLQAFGLVDTSLAEDVVVAVDGLLLKGRAAALAWLRSNAVPEQQVVGTRCITRVDATLVTLRWRVRGTRRCEEATYCFLVRGDLIGGVVVAA